MNIPEQRKIIIYWKEECASWEQEGKNPILFWAGRLATAAEGVKNCSVLSVSEMVSFLSMVLEEYNDVVVKRTL
jgi:hypothetical protein